MEVAKAQNWAVEPQGKRKFGLLYQPWMIWTLMDMEQLVEWELAGETKELVKILPQCHFVHQKSHYDRTGKPVNNRLSYGTDFFEISSRYSETPI
jgi:hypothetical protein